MRSVFLKPEDYLEPPCPFCDPTGKRPKMIPIGRVIGKLDEHLAARDDEGALKHLNYWLAEAREGGDEGGELTLLNEKIGVLRNAGRHSEALETAKEALLLAEKNDWAGDPTVGTTYLNAGTAANAAGQPEKALAFYKKAEELYEKTLPRGDLRFAGLYNNEAVALCRLGQLQRAKEYDLKALAILEGREGTQLDRAVTHTNLANLAEEEKGLEEGEEEISFHLKEAAALLDDPAVKQNAFAAFVYAKCAPVYEYYGWFAYAADLAERSERIYEGA